MPNSRYRLGKPPGRVNVVTFSGAHGVGKSTIIQDMQISEATAQRRFFLVPSVSTFWFKGYQKHATKIGHPIPETYDDINRLGIREMMQREMPAILAEMVIGEVNRAINNDGGVVLVDRWFGDVMAYTAIELPDKAEELAVESMRIYKDLLDSLIQKANAYHGSLHLTHVFVPAASCKHEMPRGQTVDKAMRGTQPADEWETAYARFNAFTDPSHTIELTTADRLRRVAEVFSGISG